MASKKKTRSVRVNVGRYGGRVHELDCVWLDGAIAAGHTNSGNGRPVIDLANYEVMRADRVPSGHDHCSRCS